MVSIRRALLPFRRKRRSFLPVFIIVYLFEPNDSEPRLLWVQPGFIVCLYQIAAEWGLAVQNMTSFAQKE